ncbi:ankyrin repeat domain-containing protein [Parashewanella spongiae]|uniref:Ankyrin repeat domain-containing protein n=1 Tax=Parashewanella spongiae TaxID=342950 RepID=A0A3A6TTU5_9GAMM|nr:ankyrin repeat domain-containing protein [Parashewanella spongiae]MCL1077339.1 ankyrin repeat domain-containing protein [Parashewanella spongiae]RJY04903.1 ankyrin repeat domain-containing protein [Parashewanella spongiae]
MCNPLGAVSSNTSIAAQLNFQPQKANLESNTVDIDGQLFRVSLLGQYDAFLKFIRDEEVTKNHAELELTDDVAKLPGANFDEKLTRVIMRAEQQGEAILARDTKGREDYFARLEKLKTHIIGQINFAQQLPDDALLFLVEFSNRLDEMKLWPESQQLLHLGAFPMAVESETEWRCIDGLRIRLGLCDRPSTTIFNLLCREQMSDALLKLTSKVRFDYRVHLAATVPWLLTGIVSHKDTHFKLPLHDLFASDIYDLLLTTPENYHRRLLSSIDDYLELSQQVLFLKEQYLQSEDDDLLMEMNGIVDRLKENAWTVLLKLAPNHFYDGSQTRDSISNEILKRIHTDQQLTLFLESAFIPEKPELTDYTGNISHWCEKLYCGDFCALAALVVYCLPVFDKRPLMMCLLSHTWQALYRDTLCRHLEQLKVKSEFVTVWSKQIVERLTEFNAKYGDVVEKYLNNREGWQTLPLNRKQDLLQQCISGGVSFSTIQALRNSGADEVHLSSLDWRAWVNSRDWPKLIHLLRHQVNFNEVIHYALPILKSDNQLLHIAAYFGREDVVEALLKTPSIEVNSTNEIGYTPLLMACRIAKDKVVKVLLNYKGQNPKVDIGLTREHSTYQSTPLHYACNAGHDGVVKVMLDYKRQHPKADIGLAKEHPISKTTPLHVACIAGHYAVVKVLLDYKRQYPKADIGLNRQNSTYKNTPLHVACRLGKEKVVKVLLDYKGQEPKADIGLNREHSTCKNTPLHEACVVGHDGVVKVLLDYKGQHPNGDIGLVMKNSYTKNTPMHGACIAGNDGVVKVLLDYKGQYPKADIGLTRVHSIYKDTPLHVACCLGNEKVVKVLLDYLSTHPIDSIRLFSNEFGMSPLKLARKYKHEVIVNLILEWKGIKLVSTTDKIGVFFAKK